MGGGEGGLEIKGEGSWFQARDLSGWEFAPMSKTSVFQVSVSFLLQYKGLCPDISYLCGCIKYKDRILFVQVKNKPCVVYTVMHLIPWKQSHGSETLHAPKIAASSSSLYVGKTAAAPAFFTCG